MTAAVRLRYDVDRSPLTLLLALASAFVLGQIYWPVDPARAFTLFVAWLLLWAQVLFVRLLLRREQGRFR